MTHLPTAYQELLQQTKQFFHELPSETFEFAEAADCALFPKAIQKHTPTLPPPIPPIVSAPLPPPAKKSEPSPQIETPKPQIQPKAEKSPSPLRASLQKLSPHLRLADTPPDDQIAQRVASAWQEKIPGIDVVLLLLEISSDTTEFLKNLGKAIHTQLAPAKVIAAQRLEKEKLWDLFLEKNSLRLIIATDGMHHYPDLMRHYTAIPAQDQAFLGKTPLVTLAPTQVYLQSLQQKALLWKRLCQILKP